MDEKRVKEIVKDMAFWSGKKDMAIDEIAMIQPGLGRLMPEIGHRTWKLYYAAHALNWPNALYQWKETKKLFEIGAYTRPKHEDAIEEYLRDSWAPLEVAIKEENWVTFAPASTDPTANTESPSDGARRDPGSGPELPMELKTTIPLEAAASAAMVVTAVFPSRSS